MIIPSSFSRLSLAGFGLLFCCFVASVSPAVAQTPAPSLAFGPSEVFASGVTPGGRVVFFAVTQEISEDEVATLHRRDAVRIDTDGDGVVFFDLGGPVTQRAIWLAVDLATGAYALATPNGEPPSQTEFAGEGLVLGAPLGAPDSVEDTRTFLEVLLVRPGVAAWAQTIADGGTTDADDKVDGAVDAAIDSLSQIDPDTGESPAPDRFGTQDLIFSFDPMSMEIVTASATTLVGGAR
ncbi:MAG TPA: hypothetical protein VGS22_26260 [Thermoanaerobaculia bacterium]|jgi:hypothetical protein|nr:hypothetical protein [Thermoanaerobaculia bacterium]